MEEVYSTSEYMAVLRRRKQPLLIFSLGTVLLAIALAFGLPPVYRSTGTILVEQQEIPLDFVRSTVTSYADQRIQVIRQRVMSRDNMEQIVIRYGLVEDPSNAEAMAQAVSEMRDAIAMEMIDARVINARTGSAGLATIAFTVSYDSHDPLTAREVAREVVDLYLKQNVDERTQSAAQTTNFLAQEAERLRQELTDTEVALARFKQENAERMPTGRDLTLQYLDRADRELTQLDRDVRELRQERGLIEVELSQTPPVVLTVFDESGEVIQAATTRLQELEAEYLRLLSIYSSEHPDVVALRKEIQLMTGGDTSGTLIQLENSLEQRRAELDLAEQRYSGAHPDVMRLRRSVENLQEEIERARSAAPRGVPQPNNPAYIALQVRLEATNEEIAALSGRRDELRANISQYEAQLLAMPEVEREMLMLTREYDLARQGYNEIREQQTQARLAETLESESKGERFTVIDPPGLPVSPVSPNRPAILFLGIVLALAAGIGVVALTEALDGTVRSSRDLRAELEAPPLVAIPYVENNSDIARRRIRYLAYSAAVVTAAVATYASV